MSKLKLSRNYLVWMRLFLAILVWGTQNMSWAGVTCIIQRLSCSSCLWKESYFLFLATRTLGTVRKYHAAFPCHRWRGHDVAADKYVTSLWQLPGFWHVSLSWFMKSWLFVFWALCGIWQSVFCTVEWMVIAQLLPVSIHSFGEINKIDTAYDTLMLLWIINEIHRSIFL